MKVSEQPAITHNVTRNCIVTGRATSRESLLLLNVGFVRLKEKWCSVSILSQRFCEQAHVCAEKYEEIRVGRLLSGSKWKMRTETIFTGSTASVDCCLFSSWYWWSKSWGIILDITGGRQTGCFFHWCYWGLLFPPEFYGDGYVITGNCFNASQMIYNSLFHYPQPALIREIKEIV